jgi:hypothetical protein
MSDTDLEKAVAEVKKSLDASRKNNEIFKLLKKELDSVLGDSILDKEQTKLEEQSGSSYASKLTRESAKMELQSNDSFMIFYSVLIFTFLTGLLTIINIWGNQNQYVQTVLFVINQGMIVGILFCISQVFFILRENHDIVFDTDLFPDLKEFFKGRGVAEKLPFLRSPSFKAILLLIVAIVFELLIIFKILIK